MSSSVRAPGRSAFRSSRRGWPQGSRPRSGEDHPEDLNSQVHYYDGIVEELRNENVSRETEDRNSFTLAKLHSQTGPPFQLFGVPGPLHFDLRSGAINLAEIVGGKLD